MVKATERAKDFVTERYEHLRKCFGEYDPFVQGYADCMRVLKLDRQAGGKQWNAK